MVDPQSLRSLFGMAPTPLLLLDGEGRVVVCTGSLAGHAPEALEGLPLSHLVPDENRAMVQLALANAVSPMIPHTLDLPVKTPSGEVRWYQANIAPLHPPENGASVLVTLSDITERRREEERLRRSEQLMTDAQGTAHLGTWEWDLKDPYVRWSEQLYRMYGVDPATHTPSFHDFLSRVHPDDREKARQATERIMREKQPVSHDERVFRPDGEVRHLYSWIKPVCDESGKLVKLLGVCQDITERARAEEERNQLLEREQQARAVAEAAERRAAMLAEASRALSSSLNHEEVVHKAVWVGLSSGLAEGCVLLLLEGTERPMRIEVAHVEPDQEAWARAILERNPPELEDSGGAVRVVRTGRAEFLPVVGEAAASSDPWVSASARTDWPVRSWLCVPVVSHGAVRGALALFRSIGQPFERTDLLLAEQLADRIAVALENALLLREAREAVRVRDEFLSIASHELRTPLTALRLQLDSLLRPLEAGEVTLERLTHNLHTMLRQVERLTQLINNLLEVTRVQLGMQLAPEPTDLGALVRRVVAQFEVELERASCPLVLRLEEEVRGKWDAFGLEQVLTNLLSNAVRYGAGHPVEVAVERMDGGRARLWVRDHGIGIAPQDVERIFGRFERAVSARHYGGLGLGLFISRQIVEAHGGTIRAESWPGEGSRFVVELPPEAPRLAASSASFRPGLA
jgi:PAS domain S-box-containing protein